MNTPSLRMLVAAIVSASHELNAIDFWRFGLEIYSVPVDHYHPATHALA